VYNSLHNVVPYVVPYMSPQPFASRTLRFGLFELDLRGGELCKRGRKVKLQGQPFQVLELLLSRPGELVTREELQQARLQASSIPGTHPNERSRNRSIGHLGMRRSRPLHFRLHDVAALRPR